MEPPPPRATRSSHGRVRYEHERARTIAVVPQTAELFQGTLLENVTFGDTSIERVVVESAARTSGAAMFIESLPWATTRRSTPAAAQVACTCLPASNSCSRSRAPVLLLDEATAAVRAITDAAFRQALREKVLPRGCAVLTVAHRLATARSGSGRVARWRAHH